VGADGTEDMGPAKGGGEVGGSIPGTCCGCWRELPLKWRGAQGTRMRSLGERRSKLGLRHRGLDCKKISEG